MIRFQDIAPTKRDSTNLEIHRWPISQNMNTKMLRLFLLLPIALIAALPLVAQTEISVKNPSFESPLAVEVSQSMDNLNAALGFAGEGWTSSRHRAPSSALALINRDFDPAYPDPADGNQFIYLSGRKLDSEAVEEAVANTVFQEVLGPGDIKPDHRYTLTVALADLGRNPTDFRIGLYADRGLTAPFAEIDGSKLVLPANGWKEVSVTWNAGKSDARQALYIGFISSDFGITSQAPRLGIDHVRLTIEPSKQ